MSLEVKQLENELMKSNCYIITDWASHSCVVIDPGSEKSEREVDYIESNQLRLDYIMLTHEHTDHTWGVNSLKLRFPESKIVCSELCEKYAKKSSKAYFLFYYDKKGYRYDLMSGDIIIKSDNDILTWNSFLFKFIITPGHSRGSMCIEMNGMLFTGDTMMPYPRYLNKKDGNEEDWEKSIDMLLNQYTSETIIYPGHGDALTVGEWKEKFFKIQII